MKNGSASVGKNLFRRAAPSLARQTGARYQPPLTPVESSSNGGWYQGDEIAGQSKAAAFPLRAEVLYCGGSAVRVIWIGSRSELRNPDTNVAIILATARTE
jgi:hypothetical protein